MEHRTSASSSPRVNRRTLFRAGGGMLLAGAATGLIGAEAASAAPVASSPSLLAGNQEIVPGGTLIVAIGTDISSLEPHLTTETSSAGVRINVYDQLLWHYTRDGDIQPWLATEWEASEDGLIYTFTLTDQPVTFHDGTPFNADAVKATFDRLTHPDRTGAAALTLAVLEATEVIDERTVSFHLEHVFAPFLRRIADGAGAIMSPAQIDALGADYGQHPIGTGPYKFVEYVTGDHVTFEANPDHWRGAPNFDRIEYRIVPEDAARTTLLETGEAQVIDRVTPQLTEVILSNPDLKVEETLTSRIIYFMLNQARPFFQDARTRQAVNHAVDRESIIASILRGYAVRADSPVSSAVEFHAPQPLYEYDPDQARALLAEAGVTDGAEIIMWSPQGRYVGDRDISTAVQAMLGEVGLNVDLYTFGDFPAYLEQLHSLEWDIAMLGWANSNDIDGALNQTFSSDFVGIFPNYGSYSNPEVDEILNDAVSELDDTRRGELYAEAQRIIVEEAGALFLHWQINLTGAAARVDGAFVHISETLIVRDAGFTS